MVEPGPWVPLNWGCERLVLAWSLGLVLKLMTSSHVVLNCKIGMNVFRLPVDV